MGIDTNNTNIQMGYGNGIRHKKRVLFIMKRGKDPPKKTEGIEVLNQENIRTLREKENYLH